MSCNEKHFLLIHAFRKGENLGPTDGSRHDCEAKLAGFDRLGTHAIIATHYRGPQLPKRTRTGGK